MKEEAESPQCSHGLSLRDTYDAQTVLFNSRSTFDVFWRRKALVRICANEKRRPNVCLLAVMHQSNISM
jgi:hypothetical protein